MIRLINSMGGDLAVVNAARVSFRKEKDKLDESDMRLIKYLARNNHWTPFGHVQITLHCKAPIYLARQLGKHQVGLVWNEVSRRYVSDTPEFETRTEYRERPENVKQGSSDEVVPMPPMLKARWADVIFRASNLYEECVKAKDDGGYGMAPEIARSILPQSMYTEWYWTGSLYAFFRVWKERSDHSAQLEAQEFALQLSRILAAVAPWSFTALKDASHV